MRLINFKWSFCKMCIYAPSLVWFLSVYSKYSATTLQDCACMISLWSPRHITGRASCFHDDREEKRCFSFYLTPQRQRLTTGTLSSTCVTGCAGHFLVCFGLNGVSLPWSTQQHNSGSAADGPSLTVLASLVADTSSL